MQFKKYAHNPPRLFIDGATYFITGAVLDKLPLFHDDTRKKFYLMPPPDGRFGGIIGIPVFAGVAE